MLERYKVWYKISGIIITIICIIDFPLAFFTSNFVVAALCVAIILFWWTPYKHINLTYKGSLILSLIAVILAWLSIVWILIKHIIDMNRYSLEWLNGIETSLIAIVLFLQLGILVILTITLVLGIISLRIKKKDQKKLNKSNIQSD